MRTLQAGDRGSQETYPMYYPGPASAFAQAELGADLITKPKWHQDVLRGANGPSPSCAGAVVPNMEGHEGRCVATGLSHHLAR